MKAYRLPALGTPAAFADAPEPKPGPTEVVVEVQGAGICASDLHMQSPAYPVNEIMRTWPMPMTLGHEVAGRIVELGSDVVGWEVGDLIVAGAGPGCRTCWQCTHGNSAACQFAGLQFLGVGRDGGLASHVAIPEENLLDRMGLPPEIAAPLPDAGATAYHAVKAAHGALNAGEPVLVIGTGGVGSFAVGILKATTNCRVIAIDARDEGLELARRMGADDVLLAGPDNRDEVLELTGGEMCSAVIDCAGAPVTVDLASALTRPSGEIVLVGMSGGAVKVGPGHVQPGVRAHFPFGSNRRDLVDLMTLIRDGKVKPVVETFPFDDVVAAYGRLAAGEVVGRAVALFD
jgi:propanol-preferring alcohol dehydrogenase